MFPGFPILKSEKRGGLYTFFILISGSGENPKISIPGKVKMRKPFSFKKNKAISLYLFYTYFLGFFRPFSTIFFNPNPGNTWIDAVFIFSRARFRFWCCVFTLPGKITNYKIQIPCKAGLLGEILKERLIHRLHRFTLTFKIGVIRVGRNG